MAKKTVKRTVQCYHCEHRFDVSAKAMTVSCPKCSKPLMVEDVVVKTAHAVRKLQTCGKVVVQRRGRVIADLVVGQEGIEVIGVLEAKVARGGSVKITSKALWRGDCHASSVSVEEGAKVTSGQFVVPYAVAGPAEVASTDDG